ncbi:hypothetical protein [Sphingobacterium sp. HMA12]|uniref:hypothetical protein n=1 Tax=Sphingobacterium sp. HMA12 TaxID=2050894 RepID=UPI00131592F3|nr:hypothetical protein [Sphingobacterium sp. HMA12]
MDKIRDSNYRTFIGIWKTSGEVRVGAKTVSLVGVDSYEFILDQNCILHKANVNIGDERSETFEMITMLPGDKVKMQYANSRGESGVMTGNLTNSIFTIEGDGIKFNGRMNNNCSILVGNWYMQAENGDWEQFITLKLEKY